MYFLKVGEQEIKIKSFAGVLSIFLFIYHSLSLLIITSFFSQSDVSDLATLMATPHARYQSAWTRSDIQVEATSQCLSCDRALQSTKIKASLTCAICSVTYYGILCQHPRVLFTRISIYSEIIMSWLSICGKRPSL